jgi:hypothetical protein
VVRPTTETRFNRKLYISEQNKIGLYNTSGQVVVQLVTALRYKPEGRAFDSQCHYGLEVDSASNRNEYQANFLGVKSAGEYG